MVEAAFGQGLCGKLPKNMKMKKIYQKIKDHPYTKIILKNKHFQKYEKWVLVILWAGAIFYLSSQPLAFFAAFDVWSWIIRKLAHMFEFGMLCFLIFRILKNIEKKHIYWDLFWAIIFTVLYAISDEYHQSFISQRVGTYKDVLIDSLGIILSAWIIYLHYHTHYKIKKFSLN